VTVDLECAQHLLAICDEFEAGSLSLPALQAEILSHGPALDGMDRDLIGFVYTTEVELESVKHTHEEKDWHRVGIETIAELRRRLRSILMCKYDRVLKAISDYRDGVIGYREFRGWVEPAGVSLSEERGNFDGKFGNKLDAWFEYMEFCYPDDDRYELACSLGNFIEKVIREKPRSIELPSDDRVVREQRL